MAPSCMVLVSCAACRPIVSRARTNNIKITSLCICALHADRKIYVRLAAVQVTNVRHNEIRMSATANRPLRQFEDRH